MLRLWGSLLRQRERSQLLRLWGSLLSERERSQLLRLWGSLLSLRSLFPVRVTSRNTMLLYRLAVVKGMVGTPLRNTTARGVSL